MMVTPTGIGPIVSGRPAIIIANTVVGLSLGLLVLFAGRGLYDSLMSSKSKQAAK